MSELKENVEKLNNLYFELNGMYSGAVEALKHAGKQSDEVCFLEETLDLKYLSPYLEELDDYVIEKIFHGLDINAYLYKDKPLHNSYISNDISFNTGSACFFIIHNS